MAKRTVPGGPLSDSAERLLQFIRTYYQDKGIPPSYREIQARLGYKAIGSVQAHIRRLRERGLLESALRGNIARSRSLLPSEMKASRPSRIPVYGEIAAGTPHDSPQVELGAVYIADESKSGRLFALRVKGNSMVEAGIFEGDYVIVDADANVKSGDIVVALLDGETTVKRYVKTKKEVYLKPENREMDPIPVRGQKELVIQGRVVGLQRRF